MERKRLWAMFSLHYHTCPHNYSVSILSAEKQMKGNDDQDIKKTTNIVDRKSLEYSNMAQNQISCPFSFTIKVTICVIQYVNDLSHI